MHTLQNESQAENENETETRTRTEQKTAVEEGGAEEKGGGGGQQREPGSVIWPITFTASLLQSIFSILFTTHAPFPSSAPFLVCVSFFAFVFCGAEVGQLFHFIN